LSVKESRCSKFIPQIVNCLSTGNSFITKFTLKFSSTLSSRFVFHIGVIQKYTFLESIPHHGVPHCSLTVTENKWLMELITAVYCWQIIHSHAWASLLAVKLNVIKRSTS
jgi:hypothetical protein